MKKNRSAKSKVTAKAAKAAPVGAGSVPPTTSPLNDPPKRRGRPRKEKPLMQKLATTLGKMVEDQLTVSEPEFDGGGTKSDAPVVTKESLERRVARRLNVLDRYLTDDRLLELLQISGLKEIGVYEGIMMDKALVLKGQPTVIIGNEDRKALDDVMPRMLNELKRRGLITSVSERKIEFKHTTGL